MATATNRAALQTALLSVRGLRRRRLGHISPTHYPQNGLDKWGRKKNINGSNGNGMPSNLLGPMGGGGCRKPAPVPRASLVLGGAEKSVRRSRQTQQNGLMNGNTNGTNGAAINGNKHNMNGNSTINGADKNMNGNRLVSNMMEQQRSAMANSSTSSRHYVNGTSRLNGIVANNNGAAPQLHKLNGSPESEKQSNGGGNYSSDLVVVLDMDECLIHSQFLSDQHVDKYRQVEDRPSNNEYSFAKGRKGDAESIFLNTCDSFRINLPDGDLVNVNKRPNLDLFLREITAKFETYIFTAAMEVYASPVLNKLDPRGDMFRGRFYREHCVFDEDLGVYAKDLCDVMRNRKMTINGDKENHQLNGNCHNCDNRINKNNSNNGSSIIDQLPCDERRVVLVDNNPLSFLPNPSNGILVSSFYDDPKDDTLEAVMELLHELDETDDVRPILDDRFGLKDALDDVVKGAAVGW